MANAVKTGSSTRLSGLLKKIKSINEKREANSARFVMTNRLLLLLFPLFMVCMSTLIVEKYLSKLVLFIAEHPDILLLDTLFLAALFGGLLLLLRKGWLAMFIEAFGISALSIAELFKYNTNGNHLMLADMLLTKNIVSLKGFAYIKITPRLVICVAVVLAYLAAVFILNPCIKRAWKFRWRVAPAAALLTACVLMITMPAMSMPIYKTMGLNTKAASNTFILNEKFDDNGFIGFFLESGAASFTTELQKPEQYEENDTSTVSQYLTEPKHEGTFSEGKPNVIVIMSESYADFRVFDELKDTIGNTYRGLDRAAAMGWQGTAIAPTYASYTVRTEFELMFGLPVKSLNDPSMPNRVLLDRPQPTVPAYYKSWGYHTAYVHPYLASFYGRNTIYQNFSYDTMIFENDFTVPVEYFGTYFDDNTVLNQIEAILKEQEEPVFLHTTTMQNHQPYTQGDGDEFDNYLTWVKHTSDGLEHFLKRMESFEEPTVILFIGDHFPSLRGDDGIYAQLGITSENCSTLYEQQYILWNNMGLDEYALPQKPVSVFYLPYVIMQWIDAPRDSFTQTMMDEMLTEPVYSTNYMPTQPANEKLDALTYDRVLGSIASPSALDVLVTDEEATEAYSFNPEDIEDDE